MRLVVVAFALATFACAGQAPTITDRARAADADGKVLVVEFYTDWCQICRKFEQTVLPDPRVRCAMKDVVFLRLDAERGRGRAEAERLGVRAYPTFVTIGPDGQPVYRVRGLPTVEAFVGYLARSSGSHPDDDGMRRVCVAP